MSSSRGANTSDGDNAAGLNSIPTIDVVGVDDDEVPSSPHSAVHNSESNPQNQHSQALRGTGAPDVRESGYAGGERDPGSQGVPQILTDAATPPASAGASPTSPTQPQPQSILLDVPSGSTRARSGSASGNSVSFSLHSRSASPSPSRPDDASFLTTPPSPTLSTHSTPSSVGPFATSLALRDNKPDAHDNGLNSLQLLSPNSPHMRKNSAATFTSTLAGSEGEPGSPSSPTGQLGVHHSLDGYPSSHQSHSRRTSITIAAPATPHVDDENASPTKAKKVSDEEEPKDVENGKSKISLSDEDESMLDTGPFPKELTPLTLAKLVDPKSIPSLEALGGVEGILKGLGTDPRRGLSASSSDGSPPSSAFTAPVEERQRIYGHNLLPMRKSKSLLQLMWIALKDKVLVLLSIAAVISFALGMFQDFGTPRDTFSCGNGETCTEPPVDWIEGVAIMVAVFIVVVVGSLNDWQKERQFKTLNEKKEDRTVKVIRDGNERVINTKELVVGDVALLEPGEIVPCDGVFLQGHNIKCDESGITGESDAIKKLSYAECIAQEASGHLSAHTDCFVISGSKVLEGVGSYVVIAVGVKSFNGRIMMALRTDNEHTPLQLKLNRLAELIAKLGSAAGLLLFTALLIRFFVQLGTNDPPRTANQKGLAFVDILIISVTLIVVAVPEGLPLAVTLALAFATKRMTQEDLLVRVLGSCETMANASVVCTDKTGTLTQNSMTVVAGSVGIHAKFVQRLSENAARANVGEEPGLRETPEQKERRRKHPDDFAIDQSELNSVLSPALRTCFNEAICINSTAFEDIDEKTGEKSFVGSKTETALLKFAKDLGWSDYHTTRQNAETVQMIPFSSERKAMGVVVKVRDGLWRLYLKGASEILSKKCTRHVVVARPGEEFKDTEKDEVETKDIDAISRDNISRTIIFYANQTLRTIALCYRDLDSWPPKNMEVSDADEVPYEALADDMTLIGITGIEDPLREGVTEAVAQCFRAGVQVKMCTGDNVLTARSIALQCGIFTPGGIIMEGPAFRELNDREMLEVVPRLQVLARSSPEDKKILVEKLKECGEIVGVTGDGTNDGPALKTAHVGFSMGIAGTEVAKEASDIILMDDNFASIVKAIMWGRCVNDAVRKFLQFQISVNITAVIITFVTAVASEEEQSALTAVQLLWINIIMDTFAALALATDPATPALLDRKPDRKTAPLFTVDMYKQIFGQALYQTIIVLIFHFLGNTMFNFQSDPNNESVQIDNDAKLSTLVFNAFVFAQIFNSINSRSIDQKKNVFEGILKNYYFMAITLLEIGIQVLIVFVGGHAFSVTDISGKFWGISLALGFCSLPIGFLIRCIPNPPVAKFFHKIHLLRDPDAPLPTNRPNAGAADTIWNNPAINLLNETLSTFSSIRGGRARANSLVSKSRSARLEEAGVRLPNIMTMVPTIVASSIGGGWKPDKEGSLSDPAGSDPSRSSAALWEGKVQLHPDTSKDDPAYKKWGQNLAPVDTSKQDNNLQPNI
ncbi:PMC1_3 [Sanghuangporus weigelae]